MTVLALLLAALAWHPSADWRETPDPAADPHARKGGTIRFNGSSPPKAFNAYVDNNSYTKMTFDLMYSTLLSVNTETMEFEPSLARRWAVSEDGTTFVFEIDPRATWSDGRPVTAADVKWTFDAVMAPMSDTGANKVMLGVFDSPEILDTRTIRFVKKGGTPRNWRDIIHCGMFWIMPKHAFERQDFNKLDLLGAPVGGAYRLARVEEQVETEFTRVANWWRRDTPSCRNVCNFDRIVMRYYIENENAFEALKKRMLDVYPVYTARIMARDAHGEKFDKNWILKRRVRNSHPLGFQGFAMNLRRKPFDDLRVRQAMSLLLDRETMNRTMMYDEYFLLNSIYPDLYDAKHPCRNAFYGYDVERAKALLADAGYANGFTFTFLSRNASEDKFLALFNHALQQCGVTMNIVRKDFAGWMRDMDEFNFDMTWQNWGAIIFKNPETMFLSAEADRKSSNNSVGFKSSVVDDLIAREKTMGTMAERLEAYRRMDYEVTSACPYAFLWQARDVRLFYWNKFGMPKTVVGKFNDEDGIFTYWWYDEDKARELDEAMRTGACLPNVPLVVNYDEAIAK